MNVNEPYLFDKKNNEFNHGFEYLTSLKIVILKKLDILTALLLENGMSFSMNEWEKELANFETAIMSKKSYSILFIAEPFAYE